MSNKLAEVYNEVYDLMWEKSTSTTYPVTSVVSLINRYIARICKWQVVSLLNPQIVYRAGNLKFLEKNIYYTNIANQTLSTEIVVGSVEIETITTDAPTSWSVLIDWEIITYTGKTSTKLTGVTGITTTHEVGTQISRVYLLPTNIIKPFQVYDVKGSEVDYSDFRFNEKATYYTIMTQDNKDYIYFGWCNLNNMLVKYYKKPSVLVYGEDDEEEIELPDDYWLDIVAPLIAGDMQYSKGEEIDLAQNNLNKWYSALQEFFDSQSQKVKKYRGGINIVQPIDPVVQWARIFNWDTKDYRNV